MNPNRSESALSRLRLEKRELIAALQGVCQYDHVTQPGAFLHGLEEARIVLCGYKLQTMPKLREALRHQIRQDAS